MKLSFFRKYGKGLALTLVLSFGLQIFWPTQSFALTGGPSQPEVESFEPIGTTQMVDLATGDFNYNIPLMTVPGPNGGYPINLAYHAGVGMEQQASWCGLGWNINPGAITRAMRGIPDDFNGDLVEKEFYIKPDVTIGIDRSPTSSPKNSEIFGFEFMSGNKFSFFWNNYRGVGLKTKLLRLPKSQRHGTMQDPSESRSILGTWNLSLNSQTGLGISANLSFAETMSKNKRQYTANASWQSKTGQVTVGLNKDLKKWNSSRHNRNAALGAGVNFAHSTYVPDNSNARSGFNLGLKWATGGIACNGGFVPPDVSFIADINVNTVPGRERKKAVSAYGYLHSQDAGKSENPEALGYMMDFNREKDVPVSRKQPNLYLPISTHDVYQIQGQGVGGAFRPFRNDLATYKDYSSTGRNVGIGAGIQFAPTSSITTDTIILIGNPIFDDHVGAFTGINPIKFPCANPGTDWFLGADVDLAYSEHYSGDWKKGKDAFDDLQFGDFDFDNPLAESHYLKSNGELVAKSPSFMDGVGGTAPVSHNLKTTFNINGFDAKLEDSYKTSLGNTATTPISFNTERNYESQHIEYRTKDQIENQGNGTAQVAHIYSQFVDPDNTPRVTTAPVNSHIDPNAKSLGEEDHIQELSVLGTDGSRYEYGIPAYNEEHMDFAFSVDLADDPTLASSINSYKNPALIEYAGDDNTKVRNSKGFESFYSKTNLPEYAHSYMLTGVYSHDYVDLTGNGPSDDDMGYFTKFNYVEVADYEWRFPFEKNKATYSPGAYSNSQDDKGSFSYGKKNLYYVHSIETKTHVAIFEMGERADGHGVSGIHNSDGVSPKKMKYLKSITLYSKNDPGYPDLAVCEPIKKVVLNYDYSLCKNIPNNDGLTDSHIGTNQGGKLTLKEIYFTYLSNEKGRLSPYKFTYDNGVGDNPDYDPRHYDRWGNYQPENIYAHHTNVDNNENPYTFQGAYGDRDAHAAAWCLKNIQLPSGGDMSIEYEADDYGFVQDRKAMQMVEILATSKSDEVLSETDILSPTIIGSTSAGTDKYRKNKLNKKYTRLYFEMNSATDDPQDYIDGLSGFKRNVRFKAWERLKRKPAPSSEYAYDYVNGYCDIQNTAVRVAAGSKYAYLEVKLDAYGPDDAFPVHPFKKAGWQYIKHSRPDLSQGSDDSEDFGIVSSAFFAFNAIKEAVGLIGYYNKAAAFKYCSELQTVSSKLPNGPDKNKPSFIRLNNPNGTKFGGGSRVKSVKLSDNWNTVESQANSAEYGQEYVYKEAGSNASSGVADYEPLVGGEENPFKQPVWYDGNDKLISFREEDTYLEEPFGESYFPGARVTYSRVEVRSLTNANVIEAHDGVVVNKFFTCKDFPTLVAQGELNRANFNLPTIIPFIGGVDIAMNAYSQGYAIEVNDMSGRGKSVETYKYQQPISDPDFPGKFIGAEFTEQPVSKTEYIYHTNPNNGKQLSNLVRVMTAAGVEDDALLGVNYDYIMDERQHSTASITAGLQANISGKLSIALPTALPFTSIENSKFKSIGSTKVIYRNAVLKKVRNFTDGATIETENLVFDAQTGSPILTSVTNEYKDPIFTRGYPAHWYYEGMKGAWQNQNAVFAIESYSATDGFSLHGTTLKPSEIFAPGDELAFKRLDGKWYHYYVTEVNDLGCMFSDETGAIPNLIDVANASGNVKTPARIVKSGYRNHLGLNAGTVVSLSRDLDQKDPLVELMKQINAQLSVHSTSIDYISSCLEKTLDIVEVNGTEEGWHLRDAQDPCVKILKITDPLPSPSLPNYQFIVGSYDPADQTVTITDGTIDAKVQLSIINDCLFPCPIQVLHADATEFAEENWSYNYKDVGDPVIDPNGNGIEFLATATGVNPYRYGKRGIWRAKRQNVYLTDRLQTDANNPDHKTQSNIDGEYDEFIAFNWYEPGFADDPENKWQWSTEITKYSPYGFELENKDRLEVYSSEMYGYDNSVVTMVGSNSKYNEIAFDGFEDYFDPLSTTFPNLIADHGHFEWKEGGSNVVLSQVQRHSGDYSVEIQTASSIHHDENVISGNFFSPESNKDYTAIAWIYTGDGGEAKLRVSDGSTVFNEVSTADQNEVTVDGWTRLQVNVDAFRIGSGNQVHIDVINTSGVTIYVDDIRIQPKVGAMKSFVYDPDKLWLVAEQDNFGFTTFYSYDEEGTLVQVKQETERGIITLSTSRQNTKQQ